MLIFADASWSAIVIAALGSSAVGAIVGGYITTWLQGRNERDEAMRTRLIECADDFVDSMTNALLAFDAATLMDTASGRRKLRNTTGELFDDVVECLDSARGHSEKAHTALTRVELVYGSDESGPYDEGLRAADCLRGALALVEGKGTTQAAVRAVVAFARDDVREYNRLVSSGPSTSRRARASRHRPTPAQGI